VIYHGLPKDRPNAGARETLSCRDGIHFGYVGRLVEEKGLPLLLRRGEAKIGGSAIPAELHRRRPLTECAGKPRWRWRG
jgi:hypothetical protein